MQPEILRSLGEKVGKVIEVDGGDKSFCSGRSARIQTLKKLAEPLEKVYVLVLLIRMKRHVLFFCMKSCLIFVLLVEDWGIS